MKQQIRENIVHKHTVAFVSCVSLKKVDDDDYDDDDDEH